MTTRLLRCDEVGELLSVSEVTLAEWRRLGKGPKFIRMNGRVARYRWSDVESWLVSQEVRPSSRTTTVAAAKVSA
jgi:predicted DNA-binding transcriptional regulator AlpA